jgi:hypothetical protein
MIIYLNGKLITKSTDTVYLDQTKNSQVEVFVMKDSGDFSSIVLQDGMPVDYLAVLGKHLGVHVSDFSKSGMSINIYDGIHFSPHLCKLKLSEETQEKIRHGMFLAECYMYLNHEWSDTCKNAWLANSTVLGDYQIMCFSYHESTIEDENSVKNSKDLYRMIGLIIQALSNQSEPSNRADFLQRIEKLVSSQHPLVQDVILYWFSSKTWSKSGRYGAELRSKQLNPFLYAFIESYWSCLEKAHLRRLIADRSNDIEGAGYGVVASAQELCDVSLNKLRYIGKFPPRIETKTNLSAISLYDSDENITYLREEMYGEQSLLVVAIKQASTSSSDSISFADTIQNGESTSQEFGRMNGTLSPMLHVLSEAWRNQISGHSDLCLRFSAVNQLYDQYSFNDAADHAYRAAIEMGLYTEYFKKVQTLLL